MADVDIELDFAEASGYVRGYQTCIKEVVEIIKDRLVEFEYCNKDDACHFYATALRLILDDIKNGEQ